jgi:hypothetical protein
MTTTRGIIRALDSIVCLRPFICAGLGVLLVAGCGGGGGGDSGSGLPPRAPATGVYGTAYDAAISNGNVAVYSFASGQPGALLGQGATDAQGNYAISIDAPSQPILIEISGGSYVEEASGLSVTLSPSDRLRTVSSYTLGTPVHAHVTFYTHLAAGLASHLVAAGTPVVAAIDQANQRMSAWLGFDILTTPPANVTDVANATATLNAALQYGFLSGAVSRWTLAHAPAGAAGHQAPFTSIGFAQLAFADISADGMLDGLGSDGRGLSMPLSFGTTPLGTSVYRLELGAALVEMAGHPNNRTRLTGAQVLPYAQSYIASTDPVFGGVAPEAFAASAAQLAVPAAWSNRIVGLGASASSAFGIQTLELLVDNVVAGSFSGGGSMIFSVDTSLYADGTHTATLRATDQGGFVTTSSTALLIDNSAPVATVVTPYGGVPFNYYAQGSVCEPLTGVVTVRNLDFNLDGTVSMNGICGTWSVPLIISNAMSLLQERIQFRDGIGNCSVYFAFTGSGYNWRKYAPDYAC